MNKRFHAIVNGAAGGGRCRSRFDKVLRKLEAEGFALSVEFTQGPGHATELAHDAYERGERRFLVVGGDGTTYEVVNGLFPRDVADGPVELAMLPLGTGNSFLRDFGIASETDALDALVAGRTQPVDVVRAEHEHGVVHFVNLLGIGFMATACDLANRRFKALGPLGYVAAGLITAANLEYPTDPIRVDGSNEVDERPASFICFCNSKYTGGTMLMAPAASVNDGRLDVIRVGTLPRFDLIGQIPRIYSGSHVDHRDAQYGRTQRIDFVVPREQLCMIDGEIISLTLRSLEVLPSALWVVA